MGTAVDMTDHEGKRRRALDAKQVKSMPTKSMATDDKMPLLPRTGHDKKGGAFQGAWHSLFVVTLVCLFFGLNIALNLYNKFVFKSYHFDFPVLIIMWHQLVAFIVLSCLTSIPAFNKAAGINVEDLKWSWKLDDMGPIVLISILFSINTTSNNASLMYTTLSLNQIVKSCTPICTLIFSIPIERKSYPWPTYVTTSVIVAGVAMVAWANPGMEIHGFLLVMYSLLTAGIQISLIAKVLTTSVKGVVHFSLATAIPTVVFGIPFFCLLELEKFLEYIGNGDGEEGGVMHAFIYLSIGAVMALAYNLSRWAVVQHTSSLFLAMIGNFKIGCLVALSSVLFGDQLTATNMVGVAVTIGAFCVHTILQKSERFRATTKSETASATDEDGKAAEELRAKRIKIVAGVTVTGLIVGYVVILLWSLLLHPVTHQNGRVLDHQALYTSSKDHLNDVRGEDKGMDDGYMSYEHEAWWEMMLDPEVVAIHGPIY